MIKQATGAVNAHASGGFAGGAQTVRSHGAGSAMGDGL